MRRLLLIGLVVALVLVFAGCVGDGANTEPTDDLESSPDHSSMGDDGPEGGLDENDRGATPACRNGSATVEDSPAPGRHSPAPGRYSPATEDLGGSLVTEGLVLRLEADSGVTTDGGSVTKWADQSGEGNHLTAAGDPVLRSDALNGHDVISLDGEDDLLNRSRGLSGLPQDDEDRTMFVVVRHDGVGSGGIGYGRPRYGRNHAFQLTVDEDGLLELNAFGKPNDYLVPINGTRDGWMTRSVVVADDNFAHYRNGDLYDTGTHGFDTILDRIVVGAEIDYDPHVEMQVAAMLVYDRALTRAERDQVEAYLQGKYLPGIARDTNTRPVTKGDSATVTNGSSVEIDVLANDRDPDGALDPGSVVAINRSRGRRGPMYGRVSVDRTTGTITYDHAGSCLISFYACSPGGSDSFTYTVLDDDGKPSNVATVVVNVTAPNAPAEEGSAGRGSGTGRPGGDSG